MLSHKEACTEINKYMSLAQNRTGADKYKGNGWGIQYFTQDVDYIINNLLQGRGSNRPRAFFFITILRHILKKNGY